MMNILRKLYNSMFGQQTAHDYALDELAEAERQFLKHTSAAEYSTHVAAYYGGVMARLTTYIKSKK